LSLGESLRLLAQKTNWLGNPRVPFIDPFGIVRFASSLLGNGGNRVSGDDWIALAMDFDARYSRPTELERDSMPRT
jgi:hypothetical protein